MTISKTTIIFLLVAALAALGIYVYLQRRKTGEPSRLIASLLPEQATPFNPFQPVTQNVVTPPNYSPYAPPRVYSSSGGYSSTGSTGGGGGVSTGGGSTGGSSSSGGFSGQ